MKSTLKQTKFAIKYVGTPKYVAFIIKKSFTIKKICVGEHQTNNLFFSKQHSSVPCTENTALLVMCATF